MTEKPLDPILSPRPQKAAIGRKADLIAALLAGTGAIFSSLASIWFFSGFAENDTRLEHLSSAFFLTLLLFAFAILPFGITARFAFLAYRQSVKKTHLVWTLILMLPWIGLGGLSIMHTPLPVWCGLLMTLGAVLLSLWAVVSLILERNVSLSNTLSSQLNEMPDDRI